MVTFLISWLVVSVVGAICFAIAIRSAVKIDSRLPFLKGDYVEEKKEDKQNK
jgi:hypothetical protein